MMEDKKKIAELIKGIKSKDENTVLNTVKQIRKEGSTAILPELIYLLNNTNSNDIKKTTTNILNDLKDNKAVPHIIEAIKNEQFSNIKHTLISSCWQSGLDYSKDINIFVDQIIKSDFSLAFEAFTVIENMQDNISKDIIIPELEKIDISLKNEKNKEKQMLLNELIKLFQEIISD